LDIPGAVSEGTEAELLFVVEEKWSCLSLFEKKKDVEEEICQ
jgi:hypothetical protein